MARAPLVRHLSVLLLPIALRNPANASNLQTWKANQDAAAKASKLAHFPEAEKFLVGTVVSPDAFRKAADLALAGAKPYEHNAFKVELAKQSIVRALTLAAQGAQA